VSLQKKSMEIRSFIAGLLVMFAAIITLPVLSVKITITNPFGVWGTLAVAALCLVISYYILRV
jgi:hypothetical protein